MKKVILSLGIIAAFAFTSCKSETKTDSRIAVNTAIVLNSETVDITFGVRGNCGMCKTTIEKAALSVEGVGSADWDRDNKSINVSFTDSKTNANAIHEAIAASGYDTEKVAGNLGAYENLPGCCKYDHEMEMNQSGNSKDDKHGH